MVIYVRTQGAKIVKEGRHLLVKKGDAVFHTLFTYKLRQLIIFGNVEITHPAFVQLMRHNIDTVFLSISGRYLGRIAPPEAKNVFLHKSQFQMLTDSEFSLRFARSVVKGKLLNMATLLMRIKRSKKEHETGKNARNIRDLVELVEESRSIDSIRGYEGRGTALYFSAFSRGLINNMGFIRRVRRPPTDPVNSVLSLLYTFLMNRVYTATRIAGLDPYPGFLHSIDYGRFSLVLDLMEEFRTIIAETLTLSLFNLKILKEEDFYTEVPMLDNGTFNTESNEMPDVTKDPIGLISNDDGNTDIFDLPEQRMAEEKSTLEFSTNKYPVKLQNNAFKKVIESFEKKLTTSFYYPLAGRSMTYSDVINYQAGHFRKVIEGEMKIYQPVQLR